MGTLIKNGIDYTNDRTPNYSLLLNKPQINGVELVGNKTSKDLKLISEKNFQDVVADAYSDIANYVIGDYFLYNDKLYRVIANCQGIYPPNELYYEETTLTREQGGIRFGIDGDGNYGYYKGDDTFVPFKSGGGEIPPMKLTVLTGSTYGVGIVVIKTDKKYSGITFSHNTQMTIAGSNNPYVWNNAVYMTFWAINGTAPTGVSGDKGVVLTMTPNVPVDISDYDYVGFQYRKDNSATVLMNMFSLTPKEGYTPPERKYILKDGAFMGGLNTEYKTAGTITQGTDFVNLASTSYSNGIGVYCDPSLYKRLVFVANGENNNSITSRIYTGESHNTFLTNAYYVTTVNLSIFSTPTWVWFCPSTNARFYDIYLEPIGDASPQALSLNDEDFVVE